MEHKTLNFGQTLTEAIAIGTKNAPSIIGAVILWVLTIWIPYINLGTTIAITLLPTELAKGNIINPLAIFDSKYRRYMGEYILTAGLMFLGILFSAFFLIFPAIVISLAWSLSLYFLIEKGKNPMEAIKASNDATYGSKWTMFFISLVFNVAVIVLRFIGTYLFSSVISSAFLTIVWVIVVAVLCAAISIAINASYWRQLKDNVA